MLDRVQRLDLCEPDRKKLTEYLQSIGAELTRRKLHKLELEIDLGIHIPGS